MVVSTIEIFSHSCNGSKSLSVHAAFVFQPLLNAILVAVLGCANNLFAILLSIAVGAAIVGCCNHASHVTFLDLLFSPCILQRLSFCCFFPFLVLSNYIVCYLCIMYYSCVDGTEIKDTN